MGFDNDRYLKEQKAAIWDRVERFNNKLYLEFGGNFSSTTTPPGFCRGTTRM